ncbi:MAG TPA: hypothetical protein VH062_01355 [Polyangiaceae bacterium]|nr:hypothetical protein [Polyangiaceae bacterium]
MNTVGAVSMEGGLRFEEPFNELLPKFEALTVAELRVVNLDIPAAVTMVLGVQPAILELSERIAKELPEFDQSRSL